MVNLFKFFKGNKLIRSHIVACTKELNKLDEFFSNEIAWDMIKTETIKVICASQQQIAKVIFEDGLTAKGACLITIESICKGLVTSGNFHIYRAILSEEGHSIRRIYLWSVRGLSNMSIYSKEESLSHIKSIDFEISQVG